MVRSFVSASALTVLTASALPFLLAADAWPALETGEIAGARFSIARPAHWNRQVLLLAHGLRAEDRPLIADPFPEHLAYKTLLEEGWLVAKTS